MKTILFILLISITSTSFSFGQTTTDSIAFRKISGSYKFYQNRQRLTMSQVLVAMEDNASAHKQMTIASNNNTAAVILGAAGGFMIGWPLGTAMVGGDPNWALAGIGAGLLIVSIPITHKRNVYLENAIKTYNKGLSTSSFWDRNELDFSISSNGIGLTLKF